MPPRFIPVFAVVEVAFMIKYKKKLDMYLIIGNVIKKPKKSCLPKYTKQLHLIQLSAKNFSLI